MNCAGDILGDVDRSQSGSNFDISKASPGAYAVNPELLNLGASAYSERMTLDVHMLRNQYKRLRERQKQAHIILAGKVNITICWVFNLKTAELTIALISPTFVVQILNYSPNLKPHCESIDFQ